MEAGEIVAAMNAALRTAYQTIRDLLARGCKEEVRNRHRVGVLVAEIKRWPNKYGSGAVAQLAGALSVDAQTLYRCASVAECWSQAQIEGVLDRSNAYGQPPSWSHFVLLAGVRSSRQRRELLERVIGDSLSVRDLSAVLEAGAHPRKLGNDSASAALDRLLRATKRWQESTEKAHRELLAEIETAGSSHDAAAVLGRAIEAQEQMQAAAKARLRTLREQLARVRRESRDSETTGSAPRVLSGMGVLQRAPPP